MGQLAESALQHCGPLEVKLAATEREIEAALRLRYDVFVVEENNDRMRNDSGLERDKYDEYCDHLIVIDQEQERVIGTYRLLPGQRAVQGIGFYSESEFDLQAFSAYKPHALELGRSCVDADYRSGKAIQLLWEGIARYVTEFHYGYLIGCASMPKTDLDQISDIYSLLCDKTIVTDHYGIRPLPTHTVPGLERRSLGGKEKDVFRKLPPLIKGYHWLGAQIGGEPAYDPVFETIDFFIVLDQANITRRYRRHFLHTS